MFNEFKPVIYEYAKNPGTHEIELFLTAWVMWSSWHVEHNLGVPPQAPHVTVEYYSSSHKRWAPVPLNSVSDVWRINLGFRYMHDEHGNVSQKYIDFLEMVNTSFPLVQFYTIMMNKTKLGNCCYIEPSSTRIGDLDEYEVKHTKLGNAAAEAVIFLNANPEETKVTLDKSCSMTLKKCDIDNIKTVLDEASLTIIVQDVKTYRGQPAVIIQRITRR